MTDKYSFKDVTLISKTGKFYLESRDNRKYQYEVTHDIFKLRLILAAHSSQEFGYEYNSFDYLFNQLQMTEDLFCATLYEKKNWTKD